MEGINMKKIYKCLSDGDPRDQITIHNEAKHSNMFWFESVAYDEEGEQWDNCIGISKENALELAHAIIKALKSE
jgi:hypothetical protein